MSLEPRVNTSGVGATFGAGYILALVVIAVFAMAARTPLDSDMWWHLRAGQETWESGRPVTVDTFSSTRFGERWTNHSWLSQVGMYGLFRAGGYPALAAAVGLLAAASMGLVYAQMEGPPLLRAFVVVLAATVAATVWSPRPQLVSLALFGLVGYLLYLYKWQGIDRLWLLPPVFVAWSNLHGGYVLGLLLGAGMLAGETLNHALGFGANAGRGTAQSREGGETLRWREMGGLGVWLGLAGLAVAINPNGAATWTIPLRTVGVGALQAFISEWASPDFHQFFQQPFLWLLFGTLAAVGLSGRRLDGTDLVTLAGFASLALVARRNFGPFAMVAAPVLVRHLWPAWVAWRGRMAGRQVEQAEGAAGAAGAGADEGTRASAEGRGGTWRKAANAAILALLALAAAAKLLAVSAPGVVAGYEAQMFPAGAVAWMRENAAPGDVFNTYHWGGYLAWKLPEQRVFVDGRTDLYDDEVLGEYLAIHGGEAGWEDRLEGRGISLVVVEAGAGLRREMARSPEWEEVYHDGQAAVYVKKKN